MYLKRTKKIGTLFLIAAVLTFLLAGCTSKSASYTFALATGEMMKVELDTMDGYSLKQEEGRFYVENDGKRLLGGAFITEEAFDEYVALQDEPHITVLENGEEDTFSYSMYEYNDGSVIENNYLVWVFDANVGILIGGTSDAEATKTAFEKLNFSLDE